MPTYRELEGMVGSFVEVRGSALLLPSGVAAASQRGLQGLVGARLESEAYHQYMGEVSRFLKPGRVSGFMKAQLTHRLSTEFGTGWYSGEELIRENGVLLNDLGIDMQISVYNAKRFKFFSVKYSPDVERAYYLKYLQQLAAYRQAGIDQGVDINAWAQYLGNPELVMVDEGVPLAPRD
jgi:hypothetical protein